MDKMVSGLKVVRGPDWKWSDQDDGEGTVGTVVTYGTHGSEIIVNDTVFVQWDTGGHANYRVGRDGAFDLRLYDTSVAGSSHPDHTCRECKDKNLVGIRWTCATCENVSLCSACYGSDKHSLSHRFIRYYWPFSDGFEVLPRNGCKKIRASGIFAGATVVRGTDSRCSDQDGEQDCPGVVLEIANRQATEVLWLSGEQKTYRISHEGKVDLIAVEPAAGVSYYPDHLASLGKKGSLPSEADKKAAASSPDGVFHPTVGSLVQINLEQDVLEVLQEGHGGWNASMAVIIGCIGRVQKICHNDTIAVHFGGSLGIKFFLNVAAVSPVTQRLCKGDTVKVSEDVLRTMQLQEGHGGMTPEMHNHFGKTGLVISDDNDFNVRVLINDRPYDRPWNYSPANLTLIARRVDAGANVQKPSMESTESSSEEDSSRESSSDSDDEDAHTQLFRTHFIRRHLTSRRLVEAAGSGNAGEVHDILISGSGEGIEDEQMANALNAASLKGHVEVIERLLEAGAVVSDTDINGNAAVHSAVLENHPEVVVVLKESSTGCDLNVTNVEGLTPLHLAVIHGHIECVEQLLKLGCDPNKADPNGMTVLHIAIQQHDNEVVDLMTSLSVEFNFESTTAVNGWTLLHYAADTNNIHAVDRIVERAPFLIDLQNKDGITALHLAAQGGHFEVVKILVQKGTANLEMATVDNQTALSYSVRQGSVSIIEFIVSKGGVVNCPDSDGNTPLHTALSRCRQEVASACEPTDLDNAEEISEIMNVLPTDVINRGWIAISCLLVKFGADFGWSNTSGQTPFDSLSEDRAIVDVILTFIDNERFAQPCKRCAKNRTLATMLPCGHHTMCESCSRRESKCSTCGKEIKDVFSPEVKWSANSGEIRSNSENVAGSTLDRWPCEMCFKQRNYMFIPCKHTCCTECKKKVGLKCPFCDRLIKRPFVVLFAGTF